MHKFHPYYLAITSFSRNSLNKICFQSDILYQTFSTSPYPSSVFSYLLLHFKVLTFLYKCVIMAKEFAKRTIWIIVFKKGSFSKDSERI